jgi:SAM-dependent methyltransferase
MTQTVEFWNAIYEDDGPPWIIGEPQPAIVELERDGQISGRVLDPGCGAGETTILLARLGYDVLGVDLATMAVAEAQRNAVGKGVPAARFRAADATTMGTDPAQAAQFGLFDTVVDSALYHVFHDDAEPRAAYVRSLHALCRPGGLVHVLALSDAEPGLGPRVSDAMIRESFGDGWEVEDLRAARYYSQFPTDRPAAQIIGWHVTDTGRGDAPAWLARIRRR